jgi:hypothetical protein
LLHTACCACQSLQLLDACFPGGNNSVGHHGESLGCCDTDQDLVLGLTEGPAPCSSEYLRSCTWRFCCVGEVKSCAEKDLRAAVGGVQLSGPTTMLMP